MVKALQFKVKVLFTHFAHKLRLSHGHQDTQHNDISITTLGITTLSITTLSITTLSITTLSITKFSITIFSIVTISKKVLYVTLSMTIFRIAI